MFYAAAHHVLFAQPKQGQDRIDSLLNVMEGIKAKDDTVKVNLLNSLSEASIDISENEKSLLYSKEALSLSEKLNFKKGKSDAYHDMGRVYSHLGNHPEALKNNFAALKIREEMGDKKNCRHHHQHRISFMPNSSITPLRLTCIIKR